MALVDFTDYDDIRAALGVSEEELEDHTISLPLYEINLKAEIRRADATALAAFSDLPPDPDNYTDDQRTFAESMRFFATYAVAKHLTSTLPLFSPKEISDGKSHLTRYAQNPYKDTIDAVLGLYEQSKQDMLASLVAITAVSAPVATIRTIIKAARPNFDPVTGE